MVYYINTIQCSELSTCGEWGNSPYFLKNPPTFEKCQICYFGTTIPQDLGTTIPRILGKEQFNRLWYWYVYPKTFCWAVVCSQAHLRARHARCAGQSACRTLAARRDEPSVGGWRGLGAQPLVGARGQSPRKIFEKKRRFGGPESNSSNENVDKTDAKMFMKNNLGTLNYRPLDHHYRP